MRFRAEPIKFKIAQARDDEIIELQNQNEHKIIETTKDQKKSKTALKIDDDNDDEEEERPIPKLLD